MPITPDEQSQGNVSLGNEVVNPTGQANGVGGTVVRRYTDPVSGDQTNPALPTTNPANPPTPAGTTSSNPVADLLGKQQLTAPSPTDESTIRDSIAKSMQGQVDATNQFYNNYITSTITPQNKERVGQTRSENARAGLLDSDFGDEAKTKTDQYNNSVLDQAQAEREGKLATISNDINTRTQNEVNARKQEALGNRTAYSNYLQTAQTAARQNVQDLASIGAILTPEMKASLLKDTGYDPMTFDAVFNAHRQQGQQAKYNYTNLGNGSVLRTGNLANGQAVPEQKFQYDLGPNDEFQVTQNGTPIIVTKNGNQIQNVKIAPGFQAGDLGAKYQFSTAYPGQTVYKYNSLSGQVEPVQMGAGATNGLYAQGTAPRISNNNNPTAMTTDVAQASGLIEGQDYVKGDPFTDSKGNTLYTAKLLGDPIQTTIKALDQGGFYTASGQPRWSYTNQLPQADIQNWKNLTQDKKVNIIQQMYQQEGGKGLIGAGSANNDLTSSTLDKSKPIDNAALTWLQTGDIDTSGTDYRKYGFTKSDVQTRGRAVAQSLGLPADFNPALASAQNKADISSLVDTQGQRDQISTALTAADSNFNLVIQKAKDAGINDNQQPILNGLQQKFGKDWQGSGDYFAFTDGISNLKAEYAQVLSKGGTTTDAVRKAADDLIPDKVTPADMQTVYDFIKKEGANVLAARDKTIQTIKGRFGTGGSSSSANDPLGIR